MVFDHRYLVTPLKPDPDPSFWGITKNFTLSIGQSSHYGWPRETPADPAEHCAMFRREAAKIGTADSVYTDLVAVRRDVARQAGWIA